MSEINLGMFEKIKEQFTTSFSHFVVTYGTRIILALVIFWLGEKVVKFSVATSDKIFEKKKIDPIARNFLHSMVNAGSHLILFLIIIAVLGIKLSSLMTILGAATLAIGLALQGSLGNFAGGILIVILKPFKVGDYIETCSHSGKVISVQLFYTVLDTLDHKRITLPNGEVSNNPITNYTKNKIRRVDIVFGIGYEADFRKGIKLISDLATNHDKILKTPEFAVRLKELGDSSVNLVFRGWVKTEDYWDVYFDMMEGAKETFDREGINIPFPQMDLHIKEAPIQKK